VGGREHPGCCVGTVWRGIRAGGGRNICQVVARRWAGIRVGRTVGSVDWGVQGRHKACPYGDWRDVVWRNSVLWTPVANVDTLLSRHVVEGGALRGRGTAVFSSQLLVFSELRTAVVSGLWVRQHVGKDTVG